MRDRPNVLLVHYADLKADLAGGMRRVADFLDIEVPAALWPRSGRGGGFEAMRRCGDTLLGATGRVFRGGGETFFHHGENGRWRGLLDADDLALYEAKLARPAARLRPLARTRRTRRRSALPLENIEPGVVIGDVHQPVRLHPDIDRVQHPLDVAARIEPVPPAAAARNRPPPRGRNGSRDVEHAHAGALVGGEESVLASGTSRAGSRAGCAGRTARPCVSNPGPTASGSVAIADRIRRLADVEHPGVLDRLGRMSALASSATTSRSRSGSGSARMRAAAERRAPVAVRDAASAPTCRRRRGSSGRRRARRHRRCRRRRSHGAAHTRPAKSCVSPPAAFIPGSHQRPTSPGRAGSAMSMIDQDMVGVAVAAAPRHRRSGRRPTRADAARSPSTSMKPIARGLAGSAMS